MTLPLNQNGARRRATRTQVLAEEHSCSLCGQPIDKTLTNIPGRHGKRCVNPGCAGCVPHPLRAEVDEDLPRARGGSPYDRTNTSLMHRACNRWKGTMTLEEARARLNAKPTTVTASNIW